MPKQTINYADLSQELDQIIVKLESSATSIDEAIALYKKGDKLVVELRKYLETKQNEIEVLTSINK